MRFRTVCVAFVMQGAIIIFLGCSKEKEVNLISPLSVEMEVDAGWTDYAYGKYDAAMYHFESALRRNASYYDAYKGLGWTYLRKGEFSEAIDYFRFLVPLREIEPNMAADAFTGLAVIYMLQNEDGRAVSHAMRVLEIAGESYVFTRDSSITAEDIHALMARCLYNRRRFYLSQQQVNEIDPHFPEPFIITSMTVVETLTATWIDSVNIGIRLATRFGNIIRIVSVTDSLCQNQYEIFSASFEAREFYFVGEQLPEKGKHFFIEYIYVEDYFEYLIVLAQKIESLLSF